MQIDYLYIYPFLLVNFDDRSHLIRRTCFPVRSAVEMTACSESDQ